MAVVEASLVPGVHGICFAYIQSALRRIMTSDPFSNDCFLRKPSSSASRGISLEDGLEAGISEAKSLGVD